MNSAHHTTSWLFESQLAPLNIVGRNTNQGWKLALDIKMHS